MKKREIGMARGYFFCLLAFTGVVLLFIMNMLSLVWPARKYSGAERRSLKQKPELSMQALLDGSYTAQVEDYLADQYPARDIWVYLNSLKDRLLGVNYQNGIYKAQDGYLIQEFSVADEKKAEDTGYQLYSFLSKHKEVASYIMLVPTASWVLEDLLPSGAPVADEEEWFQNWCARSGLLGLSNVKIVEPYTYLAKAAKDQQIYYKTDHHWTTYGASVAFEALAGQMGFLFQRDAWDVTAVHEKFQGTLMAGSAFYSGTKDTIELYLPKKEISVLVNYKQEQTKTTSIYSSEGLLGEDPYEVFLGGNFGHIHIQTTSTSKRKLLLLKDSYANAMLGFFLPYFSEIDMIDARYYSGDIESQMAIGNYTDICVLYNMQTFADDSSLSLILKGQSSDQEGGVQ